MLFLKISNQKTCQVIKNPQSAASFAKLANNHESAWFLVEVTRFYAAWPSGHILEESVLELCAILGSGKAFSAATTSPATPIYSEVEGRLTGVSTLSTNSERLEKRVKNLKNQREIRFTCPFLCACFDHPLPTQACLTGDGGRELAPIHGQGAEAGGEGEGGLKVSDQ